MLCAEKFTVRCPRGEMSRVLARRGATSSPARRPKFAPISDDLINPDLTVIEFLRESFNAFATDHFGIDGLQFQV